MSTIYGNALIIPSMDSGTVVSVQDTKALTITSNGTVSVTPDAPYDALKKVDVTVDVSGGGGVETCTVTFSSNIPNDPSTYAYDKIFLTVFENNETTTKTVSAVSNNTTVSNVVLNSVGLIIYTATPESISTTNATRLYTDFKSAGFTFTGNASIVSNFKGHSGGAT